MDEDEDCKKFSKANGENCFSAKELYNYLCRYLESKLQRFNVLDVVLLNGLSIGFPSVVTITSFEVFMLWLCRFPVKYYSSKDIWCNNMSFNVILSKIYLSYKFLDQVGHGLKCFGRKYLAERLKDIIVLAKFMLDKNNLDKPILVKIILDEVLFSRNGYTARSKKITCLNWLKLLHYCFYHNRLHYNIFYNTLITALGNYSSSVSPLTSATISLL